MNILFFYESANFGGQQTQTYNLVKRIAGQGHRVSWVYLYGSGMEDSFRACCEVRRIPIQLNSKDYIFKPWKLLAIIQGIARYCRAERIDVIVSGSGLSSLMCGLASRILGIRHFRLVGCSLVQVERTLYRYYRWIRIDSLIDGYFGWPAVFKELAAKGVKHDKFIELNNAVDTDMFYPLSDLARKEIRASLGISDDELVLGWIGRVATNMQVWATVDLAKRLVEHGFTQFKLLFVGGGPDFNELKLYVREAGLKDRAIYTDWVPLGDVNRYVNAMDVVPLLEEDPHGGSIVREAMACGRIALSVDGEGRSQRRFMQSDCSILVPPDNFIADAAAAVIELASEKRVLNEMAFKARTYAVDHMSFDTQARIVLETIKTTRVDPTPCIRR